MISRNIKADSHCSEDDLRETPELVTTELMFADCKRKTGEATCCPNKIQKPVPGIRGRRYQPQETDFPWNAKAFLLDTR